MIQLRLRSAKQELAFSAVAAHQMVCVPAKENNDELYTGACGQTLFVLLLVDQEIRRQVVEAALSDFPAEKVAEVRAEVEKLRPAIIEQVAKWSKEAKARGEANRAMLTQVGVFGKLPSTGEG